MSEMIHLNTKCIRFLIIFNSFINDVVMTVMMLV